MKKLQILIIIVVFLLHSAIASASGYILFQNESSLDLTLVATAADSGTFVVRNTSGKQVTGSIGDLIGNQEAEVVAVEDRYITVETIEIATDQDGNEYEQPSRMRIPLVLSFNGKGVQ